MMKVSHSVSVVFLIAIACSVSGASDVTLEPNATLRFEFPDLPDTLMTKASGEKQPARLTAQLPENYSREGKFPLFIFLTGGGGGRGDAETSSRGLPPSTKARSIGDLRARFLQTAVRNLRKNWFTRTDWLLPCPRSTLWQSKKLSI